MYLRFYKFKIKRAIVFVSVIWLGSALFWTISERTLPYLKAVASYQVKSYVNTLLRECIDHQFEGISKKNGAYDVVEIRRQLSLLMNEASNILAQNSNSEIIYELPLGALSRNVWLMNMGPNIPIRLRLLQEVQGEITSKVEEYGLNNALLTIQIVLRVEVEVISPYHLDEIQIQSEIPLVIDVIEGNVPYLFTR